jgi:hypothetical protein
MHGAAIKMQHADTFRRCLLELDVETIMALWRHVAPQMPQPQTRLEALVTLHVARTEAACVPDNMRVYSDRWLRERGIGSLLPEHLRPKGWKPRW